MSDTPAPRFGLPMALKIAWREARSSLPKFLFVVLAVGVGVGVLTGVRGFSQTFRRTLLKEARTLMAADLMVRSFASPTPEQLAAVHRLGFRGVDSTRITETVSMLSSARVSTPLLVSVKAVDPNVYPFYGSVKLDPPGKLARRLTADAVAVSDDLLLRLEAGVGDTVELGNGRFRIAGIVRLEPDRMTGSLNIGPRILMTREGLDRAALIQPGSRASHRFLFRLNAGAPPVEQVSRELRQAFPGSLITDFREVHPRIETGLKRATTFLSFVSLIAMIIGALGVAMAMHSHLQQRVDTIAIMKCLGGRSSRIIRIFLTQAVMLGMAGGTLGVLFGVGVQASLPLLIERYFPTRPERVYDVQSAIQGLAVAILATTLFTLPPLLGIRDVRPAIIFRREMLEFRGTLRERWVRARASLTAGAAVLAGVALIAAWLAGGGWPNAIRTSMIFLGGLAAGLATLSAVAWVLLRALKAWLRTPALRLPASLRHGIANLHRPGNHVQAVLVALGTGVMFTLSVYLLQHGLVAEMMRSAPKDMPNVFLINITAREKDGLTELLRRQKGLESEAEIHAAVRARIVAVDGVPVSESQLDRWAHHYARERSVTWLAAKPRNITVVDGSWWAESSTGRTSPRLCVAEQTARVLHVKPGSRIDWIAGGLPLTARVACVHRAEEVRFGPDLDFVFNPGALDGMPMMYFGGLRVKRDDVAALQRATYRQYPTVTVINAAEVLAIVQEVVDQVALVVRFVAVFAILAGAIILASSVAGTRFRRVREAAILKTLGATRRRVIAIFSMEFLILGIVAGLMGSLLANGFSALLLRRMLDASFRFDLLPNLAAIALTALIAVGAGWLASYRILGRKPLEVLRNE